MPGTDPPDPSERRRTDEPPDIYALEPVDRPPPPRPAPDPETLELEEDRPCLNCGYNLRGLARTGTCPECGTAVERSLKGNLLEYSSHDYVAMLHRGTVLVLISVVMALGLIVLGVLIAIASNSVGGSGTAITDAVATAFLEVGSIVAAVLGLLGWWMFSTPDPAILGSNTGQSARRLLRITVIIKIATTLGESVIAVSATVTPALQTAAEALEMIDSIATLGQFFSSLAYIRWLAPRVPDADIAERAGQYMWLLPLIFIVGFCFVIGPLIAMIFYYLLIDEVRQALGRVLERQVVIDAADAYATQARNARDSGQRNSR